jgi:hypothetical protein
MRPERGAVAPRRARPGNLDNTREQTPAAGPGPFAVAPARTKVITKAALDLRVFGGGCRLAHFGG